MLFRLAIISLEIRQVSIVSRSIEAKNLVRFVEGFASAFEWFLEWMRDVTGFDFMEKLLDLVVKIIVLYLQYLYLSVFFVAHLFR